MADTIGWRWYVCKLLLRFMLTKVTRSFLVQAPATLIAMFLVAFYLHLPKVENSDFFAKLKRIDFFGSITLVGSIFSLLVAFDHGGNISWTENTAYMSIGAFFLAAALFILVETRLASEPIVPLQIILNKTLLGAYLSNFFGVAVMMTVFFYVPLYLQAVSQKSASMTSFWLVFTVLAGLSGSLGSGFVMQATGRFYAITVTAYAVLTAGAISLLLSTGLILHSVVGVALGAWQVLRFDVCRSDEKF